MLNGGATAASGITRRNLVAAAVAAPLLLPSCAARKAANTIGFASTGGVYNDILRRVWVDDFEKTSGIRVNLSSNTSIAQTKLQTMTDSPQWDVVELTGPWYFMAVAQGLVLPLDTNIVDLEHIPAVHIRPFGIEYAMFNDCIAWDQRLIPDSRQPRGWADFWDTTTLPGKRSLDVIANGAGSLEMALMADGVAAEKLYPLDVDRAFRSFERLGRHNIIWSRSFAETVQRLMSREVSLAASWPYRVANANRGGARIGTNYNQCRIDGSWLCVVKTTRNPQAAFRLINAIVSNRQASAKFSQLTHYGTPRIDSLKLLPEADARLVPTHPALSDKLFRPDDAWWAENLVPVARRFKQWQLETT